MADDGFASEKRSISPVPRDRYASNDDENRENGGAREENRDNDEGANNPGNNLHIGNLSVYVKESDLELLFSKIGKVQKVSVMRDPHTREPRGFGFVTMENLEDAERALEELNATTLEGRAIIVSKAKRGKERTPTPGRYQGPTKRYRSPPPRGYDRYDDRRGYGRYDDRRYDDGRYYSRRDYRDYDHYRRDDRRSRYDDRDYYRR